MVQATYLTSPEKIEHFDTLGSTNATAKQRLALSAENNAVAPPFWIVADEQTEGRGRHGRQWVSLKGNLFTSTARRVRAPLSNLASISLVAGLSIYEAINQATDEPLDLNLKWPNDILAGSAKLGGILIEAQPASITPAPITPALVSPSDDARFDVATDLIIGFGINITSNPVVDGRDTTCLMDLGKRITRDQLLNKLTLTFNKWLEAWDNGTNIEFIKTEWLKIATPLGSELTVKCGSKHMSGTFIGLDDYGCLKLKLSDNTITTITGGELL